MSGFRELWDFSDPVASERRFDELLAESKDNAERIGALTQKARAQGLQLRFDDARATLAKARDALDTNPSLNEAWYWIELGRVENSSGDPKAAKPCFAKALAFTEKEGNEFLAIDAAHMLAIAESGEAALGWNLKAIAMAEQATDPQARNWLGSLLNNTGWTLYELARFEEALDVFRKALALRKEQGKPDDICTARYCIAKTQRALGELEIALAEQRLIEWELTAGGKDAGYSWEEIAECLASLGRPTEARPYFAKAYVALSKDPWLLANEPERLARLLASSLEP
jgi:tetratricopeptide (TPR) repeat protein